MLEQAQLDQWMGTDEPLFVGPALYAEIEKHIAETRPIDHWVTPNGLEVCDENTPGAIAMHREHEWEAEAVAPMICGREVYNTAWTPAPTADERENAISLQEVLGTGVRHADGVDVGFVQ